MPNKLHPIDMTAKQIKAILDSPEALASFMDERQKAVTDDVNRIADEYTAHGNQAALTMLNGLILANNLKVWESSVLESKVCKELTKRGVFTKCVTN
jgi:hypothetical protein